MSDVYFAVIKTKTAFHLPLFLSRDGGHFINSGFGHFRDLAFIVMSNLANVIYSFLSGDVLFALRILNQISFKINIFCWPTSKFILITFWNDVIIVKNKKPDTEFRCSVTFACALQRNVKQIQNSLLIGWVIKLNPGERKMRCNLHNRFCWLYVNSHYWDKVRNCT